MWDAFTVGGSLDRRRGIDDSIRHARIIGSQQRCSMRTARLLIAVTAIGLTAIPATAANGVLIAQKVTNGTTTTAVQSQIEQTRMRSEIVSSNGRKQTVVFDGAAQVLRMIDDGAKSYTEMSKADVERMRGQVDAAMSAMQEQMKNLPPEQRARMEALMKGRGAAMTGAAGPPTEYKKIGTGTVGKWTCDKYEGTKNGEKVSEVCTVNPAALGFTAADFDVTKQLADFFTSMMPQAGEGLFRMGSASPNSFAGLPVRFVGFAGGVPQTTSEVTDASRQNFPDALFQVPAGYQKRELPAMGRGRQN
jgi:uncharacterized protein DUF4412